MDGWTLLCAVDALRGRPCRVVLDGVGDGPGNGPAGGVALVAWLAGDGRARVFADRCPHRDARLSAGHVEDGRLVCPFHLWAFDESGHRVGPDGVADPDCAVRRFESMTRDGAVWVRTGPVHVPATCG